MAEQQSAADILAAAANPAYHRVATAHILLRQDLEQQWQELTDRLNRAMERDRVDDSLVSTAGPLAAQVRELEAEMDAAKVPFKFRSIGRRAWMDLARDYPPTDQQLNDERKRADHVGERPMDLEHNPETFPPAAIAASLVDPEMTVEQVRQLELDLTLSQWLLLWNKCVEANAGGVVDQRSPLAARLAIGQTAQSNGDSVPPLTISDVLGASF